MKSTKTAKPAPKKEKKPPEREKTADDMLAQLRHCAASGKYSTKNELTGKGDSAVVKRNKRTLQTLVKSDRVANIGSLKFPAYVEILQGTAAELIDRHAIDTLVKTAAIASSQQFAPVAVAKLDELTFTPIAVKKRLVPLLRELHKRKEAVIFRAGNGGNFFLLRDTVQKYFSLGAPSLSTSSQGPIPADPGPRIQRAYKILSEQRKSPEVRIGDLARESGVPLPEFHAWLTEECRTYRAVPYVGEPSMATPEEKRAALLLKGEAFYLIRLQNVQSQP